jgi:osmotically-inducible protein OsmY
MADESESTMRDNDGESEPGVLRRLTDEIGLTTPEAHSDARPGPKGSRRSDERIREDICEALISEVRVDVSEVTVEVRDGHVTLDGAVPMRRMRYIIEDVAAACRGVNDVDNRVRVAS